jgi:voltage-gated potassium channel
MRQPTETANERAARFDKLFEKPMFLAALLVIPVIVIEQAHTSHTVKLVGQSLNWVIWLAFAVELAVMLCVKQNRMQWLRAHPLEAAIVVLTPPLLPASLGSLRLFRLFRVARLSVLVKEYRRLFSADGVRGAAVIAGVAAFGGGALFSQVEHGYTMWDGVWFAITTMTTVGYGDLAPHTTMGRLIAVGLMLIGIGFVALLTGAIAQRFLGAQIEQEVAAVEAEATADVGDIRIALTLELRAIATRLQELETMVQKLGNAEAKT